MRVRFVDALAVVFGLAIAGTPASAATIVLDDFSTNAGWTLGTNWQIGPTSVSPPATGNPDPEFDHTATADNGVLGALLGGNIGAPEGLHPFYYATSPVYDLSGVSNVGLSFWRWLNSDYDNFMTSQVEVYDGVGWQVIYTNCCVGSDGYVEDNSWNLQSYDVSSQADGNASFQVRFSWDVTSDGVYTISGWNVDDLAITGELEPVPEPGSLLLLGGGLVTAAVVARRRRAN